MQFTHLNEHGQASMVDVGDKDMTVRTAQAQAIVRMKPQTLTAIRDNALTKGDVLSTARIAGICAAKKTADLIPLCHTLPLDKVSVEFDFIKNDQLLITTFAKCEYKTGVEMEALTAASVAALTVYDMCKAVDRAIVIENICLLSKTGGRSGNYFKEEE